MIFSNLFIGCIHTEDFTNAVRKEVIKILLANSYIVMQDCSNQDWQEFAENTEKCHEVKNEYAKYRIGELIGWNKKDIENLKRKQVWQIPLSKEARLFGIVKKVKYPEIGHIFQVLLFDPQSQNLPQKWEKYFVFFKRFSLFV